MIDVTELVRTVFSGLSALVIDDVEDAGEVICVRATTRDRAVACPGCGADTARVHGYYERTAADVPVDGRRVLVCVRVRRMRCAALGCAVQTFREQVPGVLDRYQRRTTRLAGQVSAVVRELPVLAVTTAREAGLPHLRSFTRDPAAPPHPAQLTLRSVTTENALAAACRVSAVAQPVSAAARLARTLTSP